MILREGTSVHVLVARLFLLVFGATTLQPLYADEITPLPRIAITTEPSAPSPFVEKQSGAPFHPRGFNHVVLEKGSVGWHALFNTDVYDPDAAESVLSEMAALGANVIRVWAWGVQGPAGYVDANAKPGINPAYIANFTDFLRRATRHYIYVIPILDEFPESVYYKALAMKASRKPAETPIAGYNAQYLSVQAIAAKMRCVEDFITAVKESDPTVLPTVLGWALANEVHVYGNGAPFDQTEGSVATCTGEDYDMGTEEGRQRCWDESIRYWANTLADAVHRADPDALATAGMWTADAHGRPPVNGLQADGKDPRFPPRPSVLGGADCRLDFIDVHIYPWDGTAAVNAAAHEREGVVRPAIVGEYGVFKDKTPEEARVMMKEMLTQVYALGYVGYLYWVWDLRAVEGQTWSAVEEGFGEYAIRELKSAASPKKP